ncbi:hypothetical protein A4G19_11230 [Pasteurellaceae bacterium Macca]|nr:hypothetical protein [Pasteurellaceae bacterium Macca]
MFNTRNNAIQEVIYELTQHKSFSPEVKSNAIMNLRNGNFITYTVGSGKVKNSVIQKYCNYKNMIIRREQI